VAGEAGDLTNFLVQSIERARDRAAPFYHLEFDRVFPDDIYAAMLREMPDDDDYRTLRGRHGENLLDDGSSTRVKIDLFPEYIHKLPLQKRELWGEVGRALCSQGVKAAFMRRLGPGLERRFGANYYAVRMFPIPVLTRDFPKYRISPARLCCAAPAPGSISIRSTSAARSWKPSRGLRPRCTAS